MARPTKFRSEMVADLVDLIGDGGNLAEWARSHGVAPPTAYRWSKKGKSDLEAGRASAFGDLVNAIRDGQRAYRVKCYGPQYAEVGPVRNRRRERACTRGPGSPRSSSSNSESAS